MGKKTVLAAIVFFAVTGVVQAAVEKKQNAQESDQQISEFSLAGYGERGKKTWDLAGKSADIFDNVVKLNDITGNMYGEKENIKLTANNGDFDKTDGRVHLEKNVVITTTSGAKLTTDTLDWDRKNQLVTTKDVVNIYKDTMHTVGTGARGEPNLNTMSLQKDVTVKITPQEKTGQDGAQITITCDGPMEVNYQDNKAIFSNNVKADKGDSVIYCSVMELYFLKDKAKSGAEGDAVMGSKIDKIICRGNVKIVRGENVSYSDEAIYSGIDQKITLTGRPKLVIFSTDDFGSMLSKK